MNILEVRNLTVWFPAEVVAACAGRSVEIKAVTDVSFDIPTGKTVGLVGESGSGKTTIGMAILNLVPATSGSILFRGTDITNLPEKDVSTVAPADSDDLPGSVRIAQSPVGHFENRH